MYYIISIRRVMESVFFRLFVKALSITFIDILVKNLLYYLQNLAKYFRFLDIRFRNI